MVFIYLGNPLAFTAAYEQIILSQSQSSNPKQDSRQPMSMVNKSIYFYIKTYFSILRINESIVLYECKITMKHYRLVIVIDVHSIIP